MGKPLRIVLVRCPSVTIMVLLCRRGKNLQKHHKHEREREREHPSDSDSSVPPPGPSSGAFLSRELASCEKYWRHSRVTADQKVMLPLLAPPHPTLVVPIGTFCKVAAEKRRQRCTVMSQDAETAPRRNPVSIGATNPPVPTWFLI